ncbi:hypothetical protein ERJ75_000764000 [Trypanosoma vivax]|uniref:Uncharacterized protein n=1 Tax=Trypanosoma vivax (strain Y486) TaxID=1055687 RepID=G0TVB1_TRYVY|nr:hypothetical protein TRVL_01319 [Trypanosoma vivax]KAH8614292.1 hypothetical protein ERJ75_000764000 [Trypanosoma vivax]CCC47877.1 conserved hypothetical protein [Trypanosoma vivax Y486]
MNLGEDTVHVPSLSSSICTCETPGTGVTYTYSLNELDDLLQAEAEERARHRNVRRDMGAFVGPGSTYYTPFIPSGMVPFETKPSVLTLSDDHILAGLRAQLQEERRETEETLAAMEAAQLAALELKYSLLQKRN